MRRPSNRLPDPGGWRGQTVMVWAFVVATVTVVGSTWVAMHLGHHLAGTGVHLPGDPFDLFFATVTARLPWPGAWGWAVLGAEAGLLATAGTLAWRTRARHGRRGTRVDASARWLGRGPEIVDLSRDAVSATAARLGVQASTAPGLPIGISLASGDPLLSSWEDMRITIAGPRTGKTTSLVIPQVLDAPGAVLVTSNKRDVVDALRGPRSARGRVWVFDPQNLTGLEREPSWWWNPLDSVRDEASAADLAEHFASGSREPGARTDAYFEGQAKLLLTALLLAAALNDDPITQVWRWLTRPNDATPADVLRRHRLPLQADFVAGIVELHDRTRGGIFSSAQQMTSCLTDRQTLAWVTAGPAPQTTAGLTDPAEAGAGVGGTRARRRFWVEEFVRTSQPRPTAGSTPRPPSAPTLFSLSREGSGSAGPLVLALTAAVVRAAEALGSCSPAGRLPVPLVGVLDEAANVCRWRSLPDAYSHFGSRGIVLDTVLQSWSQGVEVWGEAGMRRLWSAANVKVFGGGVAESAFLEDLARLIGERDRLTSSTSTSTSTGAGSGWFGARQRSVSHQLTRERILDVADLAALPRGRAVVLGSGSRPTLVRTVPWMSGPHAATVQASIGAHTPGTARVP